MSFQGAANAASAVQQVVSESALQSVKEGILSSTQKPAPVNPVLNALQKPGLECDAEWQRKHMHAEDARRYMLLYVHGEQQKKRRQATRLQLLLIGLASFAIGFFAYRKEKPNEPWPRGDDPRPQSGGRTRNRRRFGRRSGVRR